MPYSIEPIPPADEINGSTALPLTRVKRIIKLDEEIGTCSSSAAFLVTVAAEMFIQYLAKQGYKGAQKDRRKNLQYKDLANAVAALDTLEFLSDTIPRTVPYKKIATERTKKASGELGAGQMTINGGRLERGDGGEEEEGRETMAKREGRVGRRVWILRR
ncbi:histone-fold-containing protein [Terfezia claveryi]|nr:histone-fold-containing protein [Terfezia claveryi]